MGRNAYISLPNVKGQWESPKSTMKCKIQNTKQNTKKRKKTNLVISIFT